MAGGSKGSWRVLRLLLALKDAMSKKRETHDTDRSPPLRGQLLGAKRKVSLASVLLRALEYLSENDSDQRFLDLYNELKPAVERSLRKRVVDAKA